MIVVVIIVSCLVFLSVTFIKSDLFKHSVIEKGLELKNLSNVTYSNDNVYAILETYDLILPKDLWCIATNDETVPDFNDEDWQKISDNSCNLKIDDDDIYIYIRDTKNVSRRYVISDYISYIAKISIPQNNIKLVKDESQEINASLKTIGNPDTTLIYTSEDESIAKVEDGKIIGVNDGITKINILDNYGNKETIDVQVTSLITMPTINNSRPFIRYKQYTEEQAKILDEYLFYDVEKAGEKTRAGVVAAARFLTLKFKYRIPYFLENGRVTHFNHQRPYADGEGRYYHKGLYLSTDKYADIEKSVAGPTMWGGMIREYSTDNGIMPNGLDCSGFVCWCLKNGGFDFGDIGGGLSEGRSYYFI